MASSARPVGAEPQQNPELERTLQLLRTISGVLDIRAVFPRVSEIVRGLLPHDHLQLTFLDKTGAVVMQARSTDGFPHYDRVTSTSMPERREKGFAICGDLTQERMPIVEPADLQDRMIAAGFRSFLAIFTFAREQAMTLSFVSKRANAFSPDDLPVARRIADYIALAVSHEHLAEAERRVAEALAREEMLKASEQELRGIVDAIPQLIVVRDPDGTFLYANRSLLEYSGLTVDEIKASDFRARFVHPEDWTRLHDERRQGMSASVPFEIEQRLRHRDGQYRWFVVRYHPLRDDQGRILRWYATGMDIDDRKRAEERMHNENVALREDFRMS
jgi:PAS domain S-box-containing protein